MRGMEVKEGREYAVEVEFPSAGKRLLARVFGRARMSGSIEVLFEAASGPDRYEALIRHVVVSTTPSKVVRLVRRADPRVPRQAVRVTACGDPLLFADAGDGFVPVPSEAA